MGSEESNAVASDAYCPKCRAFREVIWTPTEIANLYPDRTDVFKGLTMACRICEFEITKVGRFQPGREG